MAHAELRDGGARYVYGHQKKIRAPQWVGDIAIDPFNPGHAMLVTGAGIWASEDVTAADADRPTHWVFRNRNLEETAVLDMVSPPVGPPLLTALGDLCGFRHDRLDVSRNGAASTAPFAPTPPVSTLPRQDPTWWSASARFLGWQQGTARFPFDGRRSTWTEFRSEPQGSDGSGSVAISADGTTIVWAARSAHAAYSRDGGTSWTAVSGLPDPRKIADWAPLISSSPPIV